MVRWKFKTSTINTHESNISRTCINGSKMLLQWHPDLILWLSASTVKNCKAFSFYNWKTINIRYGPQMSQKIDTLNGRCYFHFLKFSKHEKRIITLMCMYYFKCDIWIESSGRATLFISVSKNIFTKSLMFENTLIYFISVKV